ncbi:hypothetical protein, partial [Limnobacter sp.]|uniref:hypothetical protein n=1 Tax=Limnobacter sp. TaxID=2003368 RepID=UPI0035157C1A
PEPVGKVHDHEYSSSPVDESLQAHWDHAEQIINNISDRMDHLLAQKSSGWSQAWHQASLDTPSAMSAVEDSLAA